jgi:solute carrier family 25 (adenine nucleotide translocator) protein 4/5/6/31
MADIGPNTEVWKKLLCAQSVTLTAGTLCYPIDTVRRRVMMHAKESVKKETTAAVDTAAAGSKPVYRSGWHALGKILREEGVRGLYSGLSANLIRGVSGAVLLVGYDELRATLAVVKS